MALFTNLPAETQVQIIKTVDERAARMAAWNPQQYSRNFAELLKEVMAAISAVD